MSAEARQSPKFPWDYDVPDTPFWNTLDYQIARNFLTCYTPSELASLTFDASLTTPSKLLHLRALLTATLSEREAATAPTPLHTANHPTFSNLSLALATIAHHLADYTSEERILRTMYAHGPHGSKDLSALHALSGLMETVGRYAEAESMAREVLPWMQGHAVLGSASPQAVGCMRCLARALWKQGRYAEAGEWIERCRRSVEDMGAGRFGKYAGEEGRALEEDVEALERWREGGRGVGEGSTVGTSQASKQWHAANDRS